MTQDYFDKTLSNLWNRQPFHAFAVELQDGEKITIDRPGAVAIRDGAAVYLSRKRYSRFDWSNVKQFVEGVDAIPLSK